MKKYYCIIKIFPFKIANGMEICIFDAKVRNDDLTAKYLGSAVANVFFYHGTVVKVNTYRSTCLILFTTSYFSH